MNRSALNVEERARLKVILHIGAEKTGTSFLQLFLYKNRRALRSQGYHFLQSAGTHNNWSLPAYCADEPLFGDFWRLQSVETDEDMAAFKQDFVRRFEDEIRSLPRHIHTVIISSEHFHSRLRTGRAMENLRSLLDRHFDEVRVLCYLREQGEACESYYSTSMKSGETYAFYEWVRRCKPQTYKFNYQKVLATWAKCFGPDAMEVAIFDRRHFVNGSLADDFATRIDPAIVGKVNRSIKSVNESLRPMGQALNRALNMQFPVGESGGHDRALIQDCRNVIAKRLTGKGQEIAFVRRQAIHENFRESNDKVRQAYFPQLDALFPPPVEQEQGPPSIDRDFLLTLDDLLGKLEGGRRHPFTPADYEKFWTAIVTSVRDVVVVADRVVTGGVEVVLTDEDGRLLRRSALQAEWSDVTAASQLMKLARAVSPDLPGIRHKLESYEQKQREEAEGVTEYEFMMTFGATTGEVTTDDMEDTKRRLSDWMLKLNVPSGTHRVLTLADSSAQVSVGGTERDEEPTLKAYTVFKAASMEEAIAIAESCPYLEMGGSLEIFRLESF